MADFELFNGTELEEPDADHRIALNKKSLAGAFFLRWDNFKNLIRSFTVSKDTDQSISGNKTFTGIVNVQAPTSDNNPVTLKYFNDNAGGGGGTLTFDTSFELTAYLTNPDREAGQLATCLDLGYEDVILRLSNDTTEWEVIEATVYATQEQAIECIETAVVMNPLRSAQQWVYNVLTRTFEELTTASKTIIGAINELKTNVIKLESDETPAAIADTDNVRFKSGTGYYVRTLLAIKNYVKLGLKASEVANDSTKVTGATVKDAFDNAEEAVLATTVQDSDMFAGMRWENIGTGIETYNKYWTAEDMKAYFATSGAVFVATEQELTEAFASEKETMQICATAGITSGSISNVYAGNLWITGRKLIFDSGLIVPNSLSSRAVTRVFFDASVTMLGDDIEGACVFVAAAGIWHFTFRNLSQDMPIRFVAAGTSEIHVVCGNTITIDPASTGTYTVTQDSTLDIGQDDVRLDGSNIFNVGAGISANTEVLIKANTGFVTLATLGELTGISTGVAGVWSFIYDNGDVLVDGDTSKSGRFGIKVAFKFKYRDTPFTCNLFPNASIGTWVRFEHADWCINADNTGGGTYADLNQSFTVKGFFDAVSDLIQSGNYSNIAGAGAVSENQQDDGFRYLQSVQRIQRNACTFTIGTSIQASTKEVWLLIHLSGTIL